MSNRVCKSDQIKLIMECRQSGLSDYQWCEQNSINPSTFYNWVSKLRKKDILSQIPLPQIMQKLTLKR